MTDKKAAIEFVKEVCQKLPIQYKHDQFMLQALDALRAGMDEANKGINEKVKSLMNRSADSVELKDQLNDLLTKTIETGSEDGIKDLQNILQKRENIDAQLQALLGVVQYSILLANRIEVFRKIAEKFLAAESAQLTDDEIRERMLHFGPNLQHMWHEAFFACRSMDERQIFSRNIYGKEVTFGEE